MGQTTANYKFYTPRDLTDDFQKDFLPGMSATVEQIDSLLFDLFNKSNEVTPATIFFNVKDYGAIGGYRLDSKGKPLKGDSENAAMDDRKAIQDTINAAVSVGGGTVLVPAGAYPIKDTLSLYKNITLLLAPGAVIVRNGPLSAFFINGDKGASYGGYSGHGNITVSGGTLEGNQANIERRFNFFSLGHGENIKLANMKMLDLLTYHAIEINGCRKVTVENCIIDGFRVDSEYNASNPGRRSEAIQLDMMLDNSVFGPFGAYDSTTCSDITIKGCTFRNWDRGIGTHTGANGYKHENIKIIDNHFEDLSGEGVISCLWENVVIANNTFRRVGTGIHLRVKDTDTQIVRNYSITGNTFWDIVNGTSLRHAFYIDGGNIQIKNVEFTGNTIRGAAQTSIYCQNCSILNIADNNIVQGDSGGIYLVNVIGSNIASNGLNDMSSSGMSYENCLDLVVEGNRLKNLGNHGIFLSGTPDSLITGNHVRGSNATGSGTGHGIYLAAGSNNNAVNGNMVRGVGGSSKAFYVTNTCNGNLATGNHFGGQSIQDNGGTVMANNL